jgi:hypothetical protein
MARVVSALLPRGLFFFFSLCSVGAGVFFVCLLGVLVYDRHSHLRLLLCVQFGVCPLLAAFLFLLAPPGYLVSKMGPCILPG